MTNAGKVNGNEGACIAQAPEPLFQDPGSRVRSSPVRGEQMDKPLPEDPFENLREGKPFLRLSNDCPPGGVVIQIDEVKKTTNPRFNDREEYHWEVTHYTPTPIEKVCTESSKGFCTALAHAGVKMSNLGEQQLHVKWTKEELGSRTIKYWDIKVIENEQQLKDIFSSMEMS